MPNQLSDSKKRVTYSEFADVFEDLKNLALASRTDLSHIVRSATSEFLQKKKHGVWVAAPYKTPAEVRTAKVRRISYTEWRDVDQELHDIARLERVDKSNLLRLSVHTYLANRKK